MGRSRTGMSDGTIRREKPDRERRQSYFRERSQSPARYRNRSQSSVFGDRQIARDARVISASEVKVRQGIAIEARVQYSEIARSRETPELFPRAKSKSGKVSQ